MTQDIDVEMDIAAVAQAQLDTMAAQETEIRNLRAALKQAENALFAVLIQCISSPIHARSLDDPKHWHRLTLAALDRIAAFHGEDDE